MIKASDALLFVAPLVLGMGSGWLLMSRSGYVQCGRRPSIQPPGWVFSVAWTVLYILAGAAAALAWRRAGRKWTRGLTALAVALLALMAWWAYFASVCKPSTAFAAIVPAAGLVVVATALMWADGAVVSAALLGPLVAWMVFASLLSFLSIPGTK